MWPGSYIFPLAFAPRLHGSRPGWEQPLPSEAQLALPVANTINQNFSLSLKRRRRLGKGTSIKRGES